MFGTKVLAVLGDIFDQGAMMTLFDNLSDGNQGVGLDLWTKFVVFDSRLIQCLRSGWEGLVVSDLLPSRLIAKAYIDTACFHDSSWSCHCAFDRF